MEPLSPAQPPATKHSLTSRIAAILWTILILATLYTCYFTHLNVVGLVGPDEPRYASIAREMSESGDWITPRLNGHPWFEKPPLYYWSATLSFKLFGVSESSARLPSALFALIATLAIAWLAWRLYNAETARWLLLLLPTTAIMVGFSHAAATDMPFAATLTVAMVIAADLLGLREIPPRLLPAIFFGFFLGLATLAKGPAALILCAGAAFFWALFTQRWRDTLRLLHPAAIAAFFVTALPWYILCALRNPDFLRIFIIEHNFKRFLTPEFQHLQPFWFYGEVLLIAFLPWTPAFLCSRIAGSDRLRSRPLSEITYFLVSWSIFCILFFTISRSKLPGYILPAVPPLGLLLARACNLLAQSKPSRRAVALASLVFAAVSGGAFYLVWTQADHFLKRVSPFAPLIGLVLLLLTASNLLFGIFLLFARRSAALIAAILPFFGFFWLFGEVALFTPLSIQSPRYLADQIKSQQVPLTSLRVEKLKRATLYGLNFYLRTDLQEWDHDPSRVVYVLTPQQSPLVCSQQQKQIDCSNLWDEPENIGDLQLLHLNPNR